MQRPISIPQDSALSPLSGVEAKLCTGCAEKGPRQERAYAIPDHVICTHRLRKTRDVLSNPQDTVAWPGHVVLSIQGPSSCGVRTERTGGHH